METVLQCGTGDAQASSTASLPADTRIWVLVDEGRVHVHLGFASTVYLAVDPGFLDRFITGLEEARQELIRREATQAELTESEPDESVSDAAERAA